MPTGNNTIFLIDNNCVPKHQKVTYGRIVAEIKRHKEETCRIRRTVGGDRLNFDGVTATQCSSLSTTKFLMNRTISTPGGGLMTMDLKDFYYGTPMEECEYMQILLSSISQEIVDQYELTSIGDNGSIYIKI